MTNQQGPQTSKKTNKETGEKMSRKMWVMATLFTLSACVTINVYFPAAATEDAAGRFIDQVIGDSPMDAGEAGESDPAGEPQSLRWTPLDLFISSAHAQTANINIKTTEVVAIQARMIKRFETMLSAYFDAGAVGMGNDGLVAIHSLSAVGLKDRSKLKTLVAEENRDRKSVYREIALANGHPEWEDQIREIFAQQWVKKAHSGWYYQDSKGTWQQK